MVPIFTILREHLARDSAGASLVNGKRFDGCEILDRLNPFTEEKPFAVYWLYLKHGYSALLMKSFSLEVSFFSPGSFPYSLASAAENSAIEAGTRRLSG